MTDRCAACGALLDPAVFHDDDHTGGQLCEACCPTCNPDELRRLADDYETRYPVPVYGKAYSDGLRRIADAAAAVTATTTNPHTNGDET